MKEKWIAFYNSKWFIPVIFALWMIIGTAVVYAFMEYFHLWITLLFIVAFYIVYKIISLIFAVIFRL